MHATALRFVLLFSLPCALLAQPDRITAPIETSRTVVLRGNTHPMAQPWFDQGRVEPAFRVGYITLMLKKTDGQQAALEQLLEEQQNPASPNFHDWLTPEQYADRFGASQNDLDKISAWVQSEGFTVEYTARGRNWLTFSGAAGQVWTTFHTEIHRYRVGDEMHFAAAAEPSVPASLEPLVAGVLGLDDFYPKAPKRPRPAYTDGSGMHSLVPEDIATIYDIGKLYQTGFDGTGQKMVIVGQTAVNTADIQTFRSKYNLPSLSLQVILNPSSSEPGTTGDMAEADIDLEWAGAVAQNATLIYVYGTGALGAALYAVDDNLAPVVSYSFLSCEAQVPFLLSSLYRSDVQQANAQGITWLAASGDSGAAACDYTGSFASHGLAVSFPASIPEVTAVGGTEFNEGGGRYWNTTNGANGGSAISYIPEMAWNDTTVSVSFGQGLSATGGGASSWYAKPAWQTGSGVPSDGARDLPDISFNAGVYNDPYIVYSESGRVLYGGTSVSTPVFAGIVTLLNQYLVAKGIQSKPGVGNINPTLYHLAQSAPSAFHDVTVGNNVVQCVQGTPNCTTGQFGYAAGPGYDLATGLGSVDAYNLVTQWNSSPSIATRTTVTANPTSILTTATATLTATVSASTGSAAPTGSVIFTLGNTSLGTATLSGSGATATAQLRIYGSQLAVGNNSITASYGGTTAFGASSGSVTVTVTAATTSTTTTVTANPTTITAGGSSVLTATVKAAGGSTSPTGSVAFTLGSTSLGSANLSGSGGTATASLTVNASQLATGNNTITASYGGSTTFSASSGSVTVALTVSVVATITTMTANPTSITAGGSSVLTATVKAASGSASPTGSVSFTLGGRSLGTSSLSGSGGTATASLTVNASQLNPGSNTITASYGGATGFSGSSASVTMNVTVPVVATTTTVTANPTSITAGGSTTLTATVRAASGSTSPTGSVSFTLGSAPLGSANLSGSGGTATASLTVNASQLNAGNNTVTASYGGSSGFSASSASVTVNLTVPTGPSNVVPSVWPNPVFQQAPDADGYNFFYTVRLSEIAGNATTLTGFTITGVDYSSDIQSWFGSASIPANGTISASIRTKLSTLPVNRAYTFTGTDASGAKWTQQITVPFLAQASSASMVIASSPAIMALIPDTTHGCSSQYPYYQQLNLEEQNGYEVQLTRFLAGGNDWTSTIGSWFGSWRLAPFGSLQANICWSISSPRTLSYEVDGTDTNGNKVTTTITVPFQTPASSPGALTVSNSSIAMGASPLLHSTTTVNVNVPSGQAWTVSEFPASENSGWLTVFPLSGTGPATVSLVAAAPGLANGAYTTKLVFQSANTTPQFVNVPVTFTIGWSSAISIGAVAHGASYQLVSAPGMLVSVFGTNLATSKQLASTLPLPLTMGGVSATINGIAAPLLYVSPGQLNLQIPYETATGTALLAVSNNGLVATNSFTVSASAPGLFTQNQQGSGPITATSSGRRGQQFALYVTGAGEVSPPIANGVVPTGSQVPAPLLPVSVTVGGVAATLDYVGLPSWSVGTLQVNFTVPQNAPLGPQPVVVTVGTASSPVAVTFTVQ